MPSERHTFTDRPVSCGMPRVPPQTIQRETHPMSPFRRQPESTCSTWRGCHAWVHHLHSTTSFAHGASFLSRQSGRHRSRPQSTCRMPHGGACAARCRKVGTAKLVENAIEPRARTMMCALPTYTAGLAASVCRSLTHCLGLHARDAWLLKKPRARCRRACLKEVLNNARLLLVFLVPV